MLKIVIVPFIALLLAQTIKMFIDSSKSKFAWSNFNNYGGMPSAHAAIVSALCAEIALAYGIANPYFAIAIVFAFLTIRDAVGLRTHLGKHGQVLNMLIKELPAKQEDKYPYLPERLGHTYWQALAGILLGILVAFFI